MRKFLFLVLSFGILFSEDVKANDNVSLLIRKAYIDVLGYVPTTEEMDWYLIYNKDHAYEIAINYLISNPNCKWNIPKHLAKLLLHSTDYKSQTKQPMLREQIAKNLFYAVGMGLQTVYTQENYDLACKRLINIATNSYESESDIIDYMANVLMSRSTNLKEINYLLKIKHSFKLEEQAYLKVLQEIMEFPDVKLK
jgi:hypothetical protein